MVNNYRHSLQSATMALRDGLDEEDVVVCLLHDIGFITCPSTHGEFAAELLGSYVSDRNYWMLQRHGTFQNIHSPNLPGVDMNERERWRGHPHFDWATTFVDKYDQAACDPNYDCAPLAFFEPMVQRLFARKPVKRPFKD
jgi:predicted HD phosphohydrolase